MTATDAELAGTQGERFEMRRISTRIALFDLGIERLPQKGYAATTVQDLVAESPHCRGAFYLHFDGKETYFLELLRYRAAQRHGWWKLSDDPALPDLGTAITRAIEQMATLMPEVEPWIVLMAEFGQAVKNDPVRTHSLGQIHAGWGSELARFFEPLAARGWLRGGASPGQVGAEVFAYIHGVQAHAQLFGATVPDVEAACVRLAGSDEQVRTVLGR